MSDEALRKLREQMLAGIADADKSRFADERRENDAVQRQISGDWHMHWTSRYRFVSDDPLKVLGQDEGLAGSEMLELRAPVIKSSQREISVISSCFVPGEAGTTFCLNADLAGSEVRSSLLGSVGASLHPKALVVDGRFTFVASYDVDPRCTSLNGEQGIFLEGAASDAQLAALQ